MWTKAESVAVLQGAAAAMFPFEDENDDLHWDEYGAALQPDEFQLKSTSRPGLLSCFLSAFQLSCCFWQSFFCLNFGLSKPHAAICLCQSQSGCLSCTLSVRSRRHVCV